MTTNNWLAINLKPPFTDELTSILDDIQKVLNNIKTILSTAKQLLEIARLIAAASTADPLEAIIKAILDEIDKILEDISEHTSIHAILIPIHKQPFGRGVEVDFNSTLAAHGGDVPATYAQLEENNAFNNSTTHYQGTVAADIANFINTASYSVGGNRAFYQTLVESLIDEGDINRPQFDDSFAVAGGCALLGSKSFSELVKLLSLILSLLKLGDRSDPLRNTFQPPQGLRAKVIPITTVSSSPGRIGVVLDWNKPPLRINFPLYNDEEALIDEILIIRSTDLTLREKFSWSEVFSTDVADNLDELPVTASGRTRVIKRIRNDGFSGRYVDDDETLKEGSIYYYTLAFRHKLHDEFLPINYFSNVARVQFIRPLVSANSEPPDWIATPSLVQLFPVLEEMVGIVRLILAELQTKSFSSPTILDQLIQAVDVLIKKGEFATLILQEILEVLRAITNNSVAGIYATNFAVDYGGMTAWTSELARRLADKNDPSRPPYDSPDDLVMGLVMVGGAPTIGSIDTRTPFNAQIAALEQLFQLIFGGGESNPVLDAIDKIGAPPPKTTKPVFGPGMQAAQAPTTQETPKPAVAFNAQMQPSKTLC